MAPQHETARFLGLGAQVLDQRRLADARLTPDEHRSAAARKHPVEPLPQPNLLTLPAHE
jgi:hypothetical protein